MGMTRASPFYPKSVIRISQCCMAVRNPNDRFGFKVAKYDFRKHRR